MATFASKLTENSTIFNFHEQILSKNSINCSQFHFKVRIKKHKQFEENRKKANKKGKGILRFTVAMTEHKRVKSLKFVEIMANKIAKFKIHLVLYEIL